MRTTFFAPLHQDHEQIRDLFANITLERDPEHLVELVARLEAALTLHLEIEESVLYPTLLGVLKAYDDRTLVFGAQEDHQLIVTALAAITGAPPSEERFHGRVHALYRLWDHHVDEEESSLFSLARRTMELKDFSQLSDRMKARRAELAAELRATT